MFKKLDKWRKDRNILSGSYDWYTQIKNDAEELFELMGYTSVECDELVIDFMNRYYIYNIEPLDVEKIDAHCDKIVFAVNAIEQLGYDAECCMNETIMEISSRLQDPIQEHEWLANGANGKWLKWKEQPASSLYKADYNKCKKEK